MKEGLVGGEGFAIDASVIKADATRSRSTAREQTEGAPDPQRATRAVREYLAALDEQGEPVTAPASISPTDPAARWTAVDGPAFYACSTNYLIDVQAGIIVDVEATPAWRTAAVNSARTMIERVGGRFDMKPERLIGAMAYGSHSPGPRGRHDSAVAPDHPASPSDRSSQDVLRCATLFRTARHWVESTTCQRSLSMQAPPARNELCPCGSGKRYKRCCGDLIPTSAAALVRPLAPSAAVPHDAARSWRNGHIDTAFVPDPSRNCGMCTACCDGWLTANIRGHEMRVGVPCHFRGEGGCTIYQDRPVDPCRGFHCAWRLSGNPFPSRSGRTGSV